MHFRYTPSQADVHVFKLVASAPDASSHPHVSRWYNHIKSYAVEHDSLPGSSTAGEAFAATTSAEAPAAPADEDEVDLFGSDEEEDAEIERMKAERVAEYNARKANKAKTIAKVSPSSTRYTSILKNYYSQQSVVTLDVKPWDDETDMKALEDCVRSIEQDGLLWGASKLVPIGFGIKKLQMTLVIGKSGFVLLL